MSACDSLTYQGVTAEQWGRIKIAVEHEMPSLVPMPDSGIGSHSGITLQWSYANEALTLTVVDSPWYLSCSMINGELDSMIRPYLV